MERIVIVALLIALVGLFFSRIHFHFSFNLTISRRGATGRDHAPSPRATIRRKAAGEISGEVAPAVRSISDPGVTKALEAARKAAEGDLVSALLNLGCDRQKAREVAKKAMQQGEDFDSRMTWAMRNAA